jgi:hypothetical protein
MSFLDLPKDWTDSPIVDRTTAADVVDLFLSTGDRQLGILKAIFYDSHHRYRGGVEFGLRDRTGHLHLDEPHLVIAPLVEALAANPGTGVLLALGRPGPASLPATDTSWSETAQSLCHSAGIPLLAFYIATADHIHQVEAAVTV